jgi:hypothetical protein
MPGKVVQRELRFDLSQGNTDSRRRTPQGGLIVDANISRVGVFDYTNPDGSKRRELRTPDEVFSKESLASFAHAPLTVEHPDSLVTPDNWKRVSVGHVGATVEKDGKFVSAELHIQDAATIAAIEKGELRELSCGYQCRLDTTPGTHPEFGSFDAKQTGIFGNHVAIGPKDWGRAGPEVRMHLDGGMSVSGLPSSYVRRMPAAKPKKSRAPAPVADPNEDLDEGRTDAGETEEEEPEPRPRATSDAANDRIAGENDQLRAENARLRKDAAKKTDAQKAADEQARVDARVQSRVDLLAKASPILSEKDKPPFRGDGKTDDEIRRAVLVVLEPDLKLDGKSADYVIGVFDSAIARADRVSGGWRELGEVMDPTKREGSPRRDKKKDEADDEPEGVEDARNAMVMKQRDAWKPKGKADRTRDARGGRR